jgi:hypothetical protein
MLKTISFKKLAVLSAGLAIVLSSCGLQNDASDSSGDATAAGKTKNFAIAANGYCYDNMDQWLEALNAAEIAWLEAGEDESRLYEFAAPIAPHIRPDNTWDESFDFETWFAGIEDGVPCPVGTTFAESNDVPAVAVKACYTQEFIDATVAGFTEQLNKPDASDAYKAEMQKGIDAISGSCVKS